MRLPLLVMAALTMACGSSEEVADVAPDERAKVPLRVHTVSYPLAYFAERVGGAAVDVTFPAPTATDPASWSPDAETIAAYQEADLILLNGATYAKWVERVSLRASKLVDTSESFHDDYITIEDAVVHSHGPEGEHSHGQTATATWLDPRQAVTQARAIRDAFLAARPEQDAEFEEGLADLEKDLMALDVRMEEALRSDVPLVASHPVYQYLARRYRLDLHAVDFDGDAWHDLEHLLEDHPAQVMLWKMDPPADTAARLRDMGLEIVIVDPCGNRPASGDYLSVMEENVARLQIALSP